MMGLLNIINAPQTNETTHASFAKELDYIASIEHTSQRLNLDLKENLFNNDDHLNYFFTTDDKTRLIVEKVTAKYLQLDIINQQHKSRIAKAVFSHHRLMFSIYFKLIVALAPNKHPQLAKLIGRAMNNASEIIKWRYFNFQGAPGNVWLQISNLYAMANKSQLTEKKVALYPELKDAAYMPNTIASSYVMVNMLGSIESLSFKPQQVDFLSKILSKWTANVDVEKDYDEKRHLFSVDIEKNHPAKRIRNLTQSPTNRFWCMDSINVKIQVMLNSFATGKKPKQKMMQSLMSHLYAEQTLEVIRREWSLSEYRRQRRAHPRFKTNKDAINVFGFEDTYYQIKHYEDAVTKVNKGSFSDPDSIDDSDTSHIGESMTAFMDVNQGFCSIVDESFNGLCLHVEKKPHELSIGMMLGIAVKGNRFGTKIGIIRSIRTTHNNTLRVGVELISRNAFSIIGYPQLLNMNGERTNTAQDNIVHAFKSNRINNDNTGELSQQHTFGEEREEFNCLFIPVEFSFDKPATLILPKRHFTAGGQYQMMIAKDEKLIQLTNTLEEHDNWIRVGFEEMEAETSS